MKKFKRVMALFLAVGMIAAMAGCGSSNATNSTASNSSESNSIEHYSPVEPLEFDYDNAKVTYTGFEKAAPGFIEGHDDALLFTFDFTNNSSEPRDYGFGIVIRFYQNGAELQRGYTYHPLADERQENLVVAETAEAMDGGTVSFAMVVLPKDDSPVTVRISNFNGKVNAVSTEVNISDPSSPAEETETTDAEEPQDNTVNKDEIDAALQGSWDLQGNTFTFSNGRITISDTMSGTYEINETDQTIDGRLNSSDGTVAIHLPYEYADGVLTLKNNHGVSLIKQ